MSLAHLVVGEHSRDKDHPDEHDAQVEVVVGGLLERGDLDGVGDKAEKGSYPEEEGESAKHVSHHLDPLWRRGRRREGVGAVGVSALCDRLR